MTAARKPNVARSRRSASTVFGSRTDVGCIREHNEDSLVVAPPLYAVADGMGGHAAGEVASEIAVHTLAANAPSAPDTAALGYAVEAANQAVIDGVKKGIGREGMGTTMTAAVLEGERLALAQVGDSRAYLLHQGVMQQLTRDHSLMADMIEAGQLTEEEARVHPQRSVITRALGSDPNMKPDLYEITVSAGDRLILCSDGLSTMLEDKEIETIVKRSRDPQRCASVLVNEAIAQGGHDNVTVIVVDVKGNTEAQQRKTRRKSRIWIVVILLALLAALGLAGFGLYSYSQNSAYLSEKDGVVCVYRGVPDTLFGITLSQFDHETTIKTSDLQPGTANRLKEGIRVGSLDEANALVETYEQEATEGKNTPHSSSSSSSTSSSSSSSSSSSASSASSSASSSATAAGGSAAGTQGSATTGSSGAQAVGA